MTLSKIKKLLTLEDLARFCKEQKFSEFSSKQNGYQLCVQTPASFEVNDSGYEDNTLLFGNVKVFHIGPNRNASSVTEEAAIKALPTIAYKPFLANFCEVNGVKDFTSHDMNVHEDGTIEYLERQIGCFTSDQPEIKYDEESGKKFVYARVAIPREYTDACEIIERKGGTKVSVELLINEMQYSIEDNILELTDVIVSGCTALGTNPETGEFVEEGMQGARLDIESFSTNENSVATTFSTGSKLIEALDRLNDTLSSFNNKNFNTEGVGRTMNHFEELLEMYGVTLEEVDFEYENLTDEELDAIFEEHFKCKKKCEAEDGEGDDGSADPEGIDPLNEEGTPSGGSGETPTGNGEEKDLKPEDDESTSKKRYSVSEDGTMTINYQISHDDIRNGIYNLLFAEEGDYYSYVLAVYDDHFIYCTDKFYKREYSVIDEVVSLSESKVEVFNEWLTAEERNALEIIKSEYVELKEFKDAHIAAEEHAKKEEVLNNEEYDAIRDTEEFKNLSEKIDELSVNEVSVQADLIFASIAKRQFAMESKSENKSLSINVTSKTKKKTTAYGSLFDED